MEQEYNRPASDSTAPPESIFDNAFDMEPYEKNMRTARTWLYIIAGMQAVMGIIEYARESDKTVAWAAFGIDVFVGIVFFSLALWSKKKPVLAFTLALVLYILFAVAFMALDTSNIYRGILIKILVVIALVKANRDARKYEEIRTSVGGNP